MLGQSVLTRASGSSSDNRVFVYEVTGLRQSDQTETSAYPLRTSSSIFIQVPYNRMNDEMQRINRLGGNIVSIQTLADYLAQTSNSAAATEG
jgi:phycocyanin-associated, rod